MTFFRSQEIQMPTMQDPNSSKTKRSTCIRICNRGPGSKFSTVSIVVFGLLLVSNSEGFSSIFRSPFKVRVLPVKTDEDWIALADVRFNEWIQDGTSRESFRWATKDMYKTERPQSLLFLATQQTLEQKQHEPTTNDPRMVVGAAELSPYELVPALSQDAPFSAWYVTDVVTVSKYRRQGIARAMMQDLEDHAIAATGGTTYLLLNVAYDNAPAVRFYGTLGYRVPMMELLSFLDVSALEHVAGTAGQMLLVKRLIGKRTMSS